MPNNDNVAHVPLPRPCSSIINNKKSRTTTPKTNLHPHVIVLLLLAQIISSSSSLTTPPLRSPLITTITHHHDAGTAPPRPPPLRSAVTPPLSLSKFDLVLLAETPPPPLPQTPQPDDLVPSPSPSNKNVAFALLLSVPGSPSPPRHPPLSLPLDPTVLCATNTTSVTELAPAPPINAIFYACGNGVIGRLSLTPPPSHEEESDDNSSVRYYNSTVLYTPSSPHNNTTTIADLRYWNGSLYWIDDDGETIRAMNVVKDATKPTTTVIFSVLEWKKNTTTDRIHGITIHRNGTLYFSSWSRRSSASIHGLDLVVRSPKRSNTFVLTPPTRDPYPIATHVHTPRHLTTSTHSLLFSTSPPGIYFTIERVSLEDDSTTGTPTKLRPATRAAHLHASSISTHCRTLYWTDVVDKHLRSVSLSPLSSDTSNSARRRQRQQQPPPSVIVGSDVLAQWADAKFTQVAAVSESHCPTPEAQQPERSPTPPPPVVSPRMTTTTFTSSSGSESTEETTATTQDSLLVSGSRGRSSPLRLPESVIRLCTAEEAENAGCIDAATASAVSTSLVCLVFPPSTVPVCLTSLRRRQPESLAAAATATATTTTTTSNTSTSNNSNNTQKSPLPPPPRQRESSPAPATPSPWPPQIIATISVLATLATIMTLVSVFMTVRVRTLSKKPVIRRRVVVSRRTSESGGGGGGLQPTSVCEMIDIENCCNMNVCETPCYERTLLQPLNPQAPPSQNNPPPSCSSTPRSSSSSPPPPPPQPLISVNSTNGPNWCSTGTLTCSKSSSSSEDKRCLLTF